MTTSIITLEAAEASPEELAFSQAEIIPGRAMMVYQIRANVPGRGLVNVLASPPLAEGLARLDGGVDDFSGNAAFSMGAAFLAPYVNRVRGRFLPAEREIETHVAGHTVRLPANGGGKRPGAERFAIHGLILDRAAEVTRSFREDDGQGVEATFDAGDFGGRWPSALRFGFDIRLTKGSFSAVVTVRNTGPRPVPVGLGWHPYFNLPSGDRTQARMRLPARARLSVNNYDEVLPTGVVVPVSHTRYDFDVVDGRPLADLYLDDCFVDLARRADGAAVCDLIDPAAAYGVRIVAHSPEISAVQTFAPPDSAFVVIEPQFSWADPYGAEWPASVDTGMVLLQPGCAVDYRVALELFRP